METDKKQKIISFLNKAMERKTRENQEVFYIFSDLMTQDIKDILFNEGFEIKDFYYSTLTDAFIDLEYFLKSNYLEDLTTFENSISEYVQPDIYNQDLLNWLSEDIYNIERVNEAMRETGAKDIIELIQYAQQEHKVEIYNMALKIVKMLIENEDFLK
jgi:hypothetical protein